LLAQSTPACQAIRPEIGRRRPKLTTSILRPVGRRRDVLMELVRRKHGFEQPADLPDAQLRSSPYGKNSGCTDMSLLLSGPPTAGASPLVALFEIRDFRDASPNASMRSNRPASKQGAGRRFEFLAGLVLQRFDLGALTLESRLPAADQVVSQSIVKEPTRGERAVADQAQHQHHGDQRKADAGYLVGLRSTSLFR
jgi:hypothetical protein